MITAGRVTVVDLVMPSFFYVPGRAELLGAALSAEDHLAFVSGLGEPDLATT